MDTVAKLSASNAGIDPNLISDNALKVVRELQEAGYQAYLVGGCTRDLLLGLKPKDFDVATNATPEQIKQQFRNGRIIGRRFKIVHVRFGYEVIEVATFRANANDRSNVGSHEMSEGEQGQLLRDNVYGTIEEDVVRRDFRVNALYYDPVKDEILDFLGGMEDIKQRKLVSIGEPEQRFREDPVRMLRVVRFAAKLDFSMESEALKMIKLEGKLLSHVSSARLFEEVLKLFHGGAAYETYQLLRKYELFKYLFPFTDQCVIDNVDGMPELALQNTDRRIREGKPVIPAFLFACMLWDPVKADAQILMSDGASESQAWRTAMSDGLRDQNQYVAVPRRLAEIILDIWNIHFRLIKTNPRMVKASLNNRRFRAAYDFLLLRTTLHEVDQEIGEWWTRVQEVDDVERDEMIAQLAKNYKTQEQPQRNSGEADGNSINYRERRSAQKRPGRSNNSAGKRNASSNSTRRNRRTSQSNPKHRSGAGRNNSGNSQNGNGNSLGNEVSNDSRRSGAGRRNSRAKGGHRGKSKTQNPGRQRDGEDFNARPKDSYGNFQVGEESNSKKVKVRHKRRVVIPTDNSDPETNSQL